MLFALPTFTSRRMAGAISFTPQSPTGSLYRSPLAIMAQTIRAILLASAMAATLVGRRARPDRGEPLVEFCKAVIAGGHLFLVPSRLIARG